MPDTLSPQRIAADYAPDQRLPMKSYAGITLAFNLGVAGFAVAARLMGRRPPERIHPGDLALLGVATYRLTRFVSKDWVTIPFRAPFTRQQGVGPAPNEAEETARGSGPRRAVGELLICPFCVSAWVAAGFVGGLLLDPPATRAIASVLVVDTVSDALNIAHEAAWSKLRPEDE